MPSMLLMTIGASLRRRRQAAGFSREAFAARSGVHVTYLDKVERGAQNVSVASLSKIAHGLGVSIGEMLTEAEAQVAIADAREFRQPGLVDDAGSPLRRDDERGLVIVGDLVSASDELMRYLDRHPQDLYRLSSREFEELVAETLTRQGYTVTLTAMTRDGGKDMFVARRSALGAALYVVECKRYAPDRPVGVGVVRQLHGVVQAERLTGGIVATTSHFSRDAREFRTHVKYQLGLTDFAGVHAWIRAALAGRQHG